MPLVAAAVCPHPPLLVPQVAADAAGGLDRLRAACRVAVGQLTAVEPDRLIVLGGDTQTVRRRPPFGGTLRPWGIDAPIGDPSGGFPLSLLIGAWLIGDRRSVGFQSVAFDSPVADCVALGQRLAVEADRVGLLVLGDGSARRGPKAPGSADPRAEAFDRSVASALAVADPAALLAIDPVLAGDLLAAGRAAWQVLAGAAEGRPGPDRYEAELLHHEAPYGVAYFVASWR